MIELLPGEKVLTEVRKHWLVFAVESITLGAAALLPFVLLAAPPVERWAMGAGAPTVTFCIAAWLLVLWIGFFVAFTGYHLDVLVVTDRRLVDVEQVRLFSRDVTIVPLENIEDIKVVIAGFVPTLFRFGTLSIQTAAETREVVIHGVRHPEAARELVLRLRAEAVGKATRQP
jgi:membrane protein YdbS with pleckstrin-like domain